MLIFKYTILSTLLTPVIFAFFAELRQGNSGNSQSPVRSGRSARISGRRTFANWRRSKQIHKPPPKALHLVSLTNYSEAKCNDGSPAGYYIRRSPYGSKVWLVYFEGGWFCFNEMSCSWRLQNYNQYMSSKRWPKYRSGVGVVSGDANENPLFYAHNVVVVQYCSSDLWSGNYKSYQPGGFSFLGSKIMDGVFDHLLKHEKLPKADVVYMAGSSAGGLGVLLNIDRISSLLEGHGVSVRGIADSAWYIDTPHKQAMPAGTNLRDLMRIGLEMWHPRLPKSCQLNFHQSDSWKCLFANNTIQYVSSPVMIVQFLYDEVQSLISQMTRPSNLEDWRNIVWLGSKVRRSLSTLRYVFAPACYSHSALVHRGWAGLASSSSYRSMGEVMECWMYKMDRILSLRKGKMVSTRSPLPPSARHQSGTKLSSRCKARALDGCNDPLCNRSCPKLTDPGTGDELNLFDSIMKSDMSAVTQVANILELDPAKLSQQDRGLVLRMLVRRSGTDTYSGL